MAADCPACHRGPHPILWGGRRALDASFGAWQVSIPVARLVAAELYNGRFHKYFDNGDALERLYDNDIVFVYETQHARVFPSQQERAATHAPRPRLRRMPLAVPPRATANLSSLLGPWLVSRAHCSHTT